MTATVIGFSANIDPTKFKGAWPKFGFPLVSSEWQITTGKGAVAMTHAAVLFVVNSTEYVASSGFIMPNALEDDGKQSRRAATKRIAFNGAYYEWADDNRFIGWEVAEFELAQFTLKSGETVKQHFQPVNWTYTDKFENYSASQHSGNCRSYVNYFYNKFKK